jgi:hypothetical protein
MRTSLNEIKLIDGYLFNNNSTGDALLFDALLIVNPELSSQIALQKNAHSVLLQYSQKKLRAEIETVHTQLFNKSEHSGFRKRVLSYFNKK